MNGVQRMSAADVAGAADIIKSATVSQKRQPADGFSADMENALKKATQDAKNKGNKNDGVKDAPKTEDYGADGAAKPMDGADKAQEAQEAGDVKQTELKEPGDVETEALAPVDEEAQDGALNFTALTLMLFRFWEKLTGGEDKENALQALKSDIAKLDMPDGLMQMLDRAIELMKKDNAKFEDALIKAAGEAKTQGGEDGAAAKLVNGIMNEIKTLVSNKQEGEAHSAAQEARDSVPVENAVEPVGAGTEKNMKAGDENSRAAMPEATEPEEAPKAQPKTQEAPANLLADNTPRRAEISFEALNQSSAREVSAKPEAELFRAQFVEEVRTAIAEDKSELYIQLKPEVLGGIAVKLVLGREGLTAKLITDNRQVQSLMNMQIAQIEESIRERGVNVVSMEVIYDESASMDMRQFAGQNQGKWQGADGEGRGDNAFTPEELTAISQMYDEMAVNLEPAERGVMDVSA